MTTTREAQLEAMQRFISYTTDNGDIGALSHAEFRTTGNIDDHIHPETVADWVWQYAPSADAAKNTHIQAINAWEKNPGLETYGPFHAGYRSHAMTTVEVCALCDIADCYHIRARRATPAPSDKIAEAARDVIALWQGRDFNDPQHSRKIDEAVVQLSRALAGKGE